MAGESLTISTKQQLPIFGKRFPQSPKGRLKFLTNQVFRRPSIINQNKKHPIWSFQKYSRIAANTISKRKVQNTFVSSSENSSD